MCAYRKELKPIIWVGPSKRDLLSLPKKVIDDFGFALFQAQIGEYPDSAKPLKGFTGSQVVELIDNYKGDTFRAVYTVRFPKAIIVLHVFQKKSSKGIATPKKEMELVKNRPYPSSLKMWNFGNSSAPSLKEPKQSIFIGIWTMEGLSKMVMMERPKNSF